MTAALRQEADALIDRLATLQQPFVESDLSGGPGVVVYTRGVVALWDALQRPAPRASARRPNRASQALDASSRTVVNKAEFWGPAVFVTAEGTYLPLLGEQQQGLTCPVAVQADISSGALHLGATTRIPLPIRGQSRFVVLYCDDVIRVFRSGRTYSVQVKESYLDGAR